MFPHVQCAHIEIAFRDDNNNVRNQFWTDKAIDEYVINKDLLDAGKKTHYYGAMHCFCKYR